MTKRTFEDVIAEQGRLIYTNVGDSMYPLIKPRDLLVIQRAQKPMKQYNIPLYKRDSGQYVLHRIIRIKKGEYIICGDNRYGKERGITDDHIIGELTHLIRNGKEISVKSFKYRLYAHMLPLRRLTLRIRNLLS